MERLYGPSLTVFAVILSLVLLELTLLQALSIVLCYFYNILIFTAFQDTRSEKILYRNDWKILVETGYGVVYPNHLK